MNNPFHTGNIHCWVFFIHIKTLTFVMSRSIFTTFSIFAPVPSRNGRPSELLHCAENGRTRKSVKYKINPAKTKSKLKYLGKLYLRSGCRTSWDDWSSLLWIKIDSLPSTASASSPTSSDLRAPLELAWDRLVSGSEALGERRVWQPEARQPEEIFLT